MIWIPLALLAALSSASNDALTKGFFSHLSPYETGLIRLIYAFPYLFFGLFIISWPPVDHIFWLCLAVGLPIEVTAFLTYMKAIMTSPLSLTLPFLAFTPVFTIFTGYIFLGETVTMYGFLGMVLILLGAGALHFSRLRESWLSPWKAITAERGSLLMLLTAFLYSFTSVLGKLAMQHSSQPFFTVTYFLALFCILLAIYLFRGKKVAALARKPVPGVAAGLIFAVMIFSHTMALSLAEAAYMLSIKRSSLFFGVIMGAVFFREEKIAERVVGALIMLAGGCMIGFWG